MRSLVTLLLASATFCPASAQLLLWEHQYGTDTSREIATSVVASPAHNLVIGHSCNRLRDSEHRDQLYAFATDSVGTLIWSTTGRQFFALETLGAIPDGSGGLLIVGRATDSTAAPNNLPRLYVARWSGSLLDETLVGDNGWEIERATPLTGGGFILAGKMDDSLLLVRVSADGTVLWSQRYGNGGVSYLVGAPAPTADGGFVATGGMTYSGVPNIDAFLLRVDADGNQLWWRDIGSGTYDEGCAVVERPGAGFLVALHARTERASELGPIAFLLTSATGDQVGSTVASDAAFNQVRGLVPSPDGGFVAVGTSGVSPTETKMTLLKASPSGELQWTWRIGVDGHSYAGYAVVPVGTNAFLLAGTVDEDAVVALVSEPPSGIDPLDQLPSNMNLW